MYEYKLVQTLWILAWQFLRKLENNLPQDPHNTTFKYVPKGCSTIPQVHVLNHVNSSIVCHRNRNNLNAPGLKNGKGKSGTFTQWSLCRKKMTS